MGQRVRVDGSERVGDVRLVGSGDVGQYQSWIGGHLVCGRSTLGWWLIGWKDGWWVKKRRS